MAVKIKIRKGDTVRVITGSHKGAEGEVLRISKEDNKAVVEGVNLVKKTQQTQRQNPQGGITEKEAPIHISNLSLLTTEGKTTRVGYRMEEGTKVRYAKKTDEVI